MRILIVAGGTGGHLFPAIAVANNIREKSCFFDITFCIDKRIDSKLLTSHDYVYYYTFAPQMPSGFSLRWVLFGFRLIASFVNASKILNKVNPEVVIGFGAYVTGPILCLAKMRHKKIVIHEQNVSMGKANSLLSKMASRVAVSFNISIKPDPKYILTGNPIRDDLLKDIEDFNKQKARATLDLDVSKSTVLVMGGSQGSCVINSAFLQMINTLSKEQLDSFQIIHLTGKAEFDSVQSVYKDMNKNCEVYSFYERMGILYKASDLAISRSGATTVSELCASSLPAILVPYQKAGGHQINNAMFLQKHNASIVINQKELSPDLLRDKFLGIINNGNELSGMRKNLSVLFMPDAADKLSEVILKS